MTTDQIRAAVLESLADIAPERDPATLAGDVPLREQLDLDSMDFLGLLDAVAARTGVEVPESEYDAIATLDGLLGFLATAHAGG
jgi:acyl carrier protein